MYDGFQEMYGVFLESSYDCLDPQSTVRLGKADSQAFSLSQMPPGGKVWVFTCIFPCVFPLALVPEGVLRRRKGPELQCPGSGTRSPHVTCSPGHLRLVGPSLQQERSSRRVSIETVDAEKGVAELWEKESRESTRGRGERN